MIVCILGDVHGNIDLAYESVRKWQIENQKKVDIILQVGDLGIYNPEDEVVTSRKIIEKNPGELNLYDFMKDETKYANYFEESENEPFKNIEAKLFFTRGNHDQTNYLKLIENNTEGNVHPINNYIFYISDSKPVTFYSEDGEYVTVASLGGISKESRPNSYEKDPSIAMDESELHNALHLEKKLDFFLTHMHPDTAREDGSKDLTELIKIIQPKFYFFGHLNESPSKFEIDKTNCYGLGRVKYNDLENVKSGSMIVLEKEMGQIKVISEKDYE